jgi:4-carboxymuconolactone decarboxylase
MAAERLATPHASLQALASGEAHVLETLADLQVGALERSNLEEETYLLVRLAALVASDAAPVSYLAHLGATGDLGVSTDKILGTFAAVAPIVGSARVLSTASKLVKAGLITPDPWARIAKWLRLPPTVSSAISSNMGALRPDGHSRLERDLDADRAVRS